MPIIFMTHQSISVILLSHIGNLSPFASVMTDGLMYGNWHRLHFQNFKWYPVFSPLYFFAMLKREGITDLKQISAALCCFRYSFGSDLLLLSCGVTGILPINTCFTFVVSLVSKSSRQSADSVKLRTPIGLD